jgi:hypothetical protein
MIRKTNPIVRWGAAVLMVWSASAQDFTTPPATPEELEAVYTTAIHRRADATLDALALTDPAKVERVKDAILAQYRALRARDAIIDAHLRAHGKDLSLTSPDRAALVASLSKPLHEMFVGTLAAYLTPEQVELVKDKMTYNKVQVTFDAYCAIIPNLTDQDKAKVLELLKVAREEAMDGGSADEKHAIFEKYKSRISDYLNSHGHDVAKAYRDWEAKQKKLADASPEKSAATSGPVTQ